MMEKRNPELQQSLTKFTSGRTCTHPHIICGLCGGVKYEMKTETRKGEIISGISPQAAGIGPKEANNKKIKIKIKIVRNVGFYLERAISWKHVCLNVREPYSDSDIIKGERKVYRVYVHNIYIHIYILHLVPLHLAKRCIISPRTTIW